MRRLTTLATLLATACVSGPQLPPMRVTTLPIVERLAQTERLDCHGTSGNGEFGSRYGRSAILRSDDGARAAYTEVEAIATSWNEGETRACRNISRLWVSSGGSEWRKAFEQNPGAEGRNGNSLRIVDWSPDGGSLLLELQTWTYHVDQENPLILVHELDSGRTIHTGIEALLRERHGGDCDMALEPIGFSPEGDVVVRTVPGGKRFARPPCTDETTIWRYDVAGERIEAMPGG
ncbi:MAG TPA: hypothetical protein VMT00_08105 [Thermoanaerobaculia bacterium]|nr:hypothetical protein [Thermoanaerobaculia bacterium]